LTNIYISCSLFSGEKIFRDVNLVSTISLSSPNNVRYLFCCCFFIYKITRQFFFVFFQQWIEEYLSNIESSSNQSLPTTTTNNSEFLFENLSFSLIENSNEQTESDWFSNLITLDDNSDSIMFTDTINSNETKPESVLNVLIDDEYSTNSSSQHQSSSSLENDDDIKFIETKLEKV